MPDKPGSADHVYLVGCGSGATSSGGVTIKLHYAKSRNEFEAVVAERRKPRALNLIVSADAAEKIAHSLLEAVRLSKNIRP